MNKSGDGVRITVLCGWCRKEMHLGVGEVRSRLQGHSMPLFCSPLCSGKYQAFARDQKMYGKRPVRAEVKA